MELQDVAWDEVHQAFAPFAGTCLYAIRAEAFFHFALRGGQPRSYRFKNIFYPAAVAWRSLGRLPERQAQSRNPYLLVCDYAAEPGFGTLSPLLQSCDSPATLVVNAQVLAARSRDLAKLENVQTVCLDALLGRERIQWRALWRRAHHDLSRLQESFPSRLLPLLKASWRVLQTLLVRAYLYENFYEEWLAHASPQAVITHNDFTALSYLAGEVARRTGVPDFTLQHGFPSQEYFPASASHYLVWGPMFQQTMNGRALNGTRFVLAGAPRLDETSFNEERKKVAREKLLRSRLIVPGKLNVLFLSQSHTPLFSSSEHQRILSLAGSLAEKFWVHMLVRPHPQESKSTLRSHAGLKRAVVLPPEISLAEAVLASDAVVSVNSTAMLEAALLHTPVLQLALPALESRLGMLRFPRQAADAARAGAELWCLRDPQERAAWIAAQQTLVRDCVHDPGHGTHNVWRYIREHSGAGHLADAVVASSSH